MRGVGSSKMYSRTWAIPRINAPTRILTSIGLVAKYFPTVQWIWRCSTSENRSRRNLERNELAKNKCERAQKQIDNNEICTLLKRFRLEDKAISPSEWNDVGEHAIHLPRLSYERKEKHSTLWLIACSKFSRGRAEHVVYTNGGINLCCFQRLCWWRWVTPTPNDQQSAYAG